MDNSVLVFCLVTSALVVAAMLFVLLPLFKARPEQAKPSLRQANITLRREQLAELKSQRDAGLINAKEFTEQEAELELALLADLNNQEADSAKGSIKGSNAFPVMLTLLIPILVTVLYLQLGASEQLRQRSSLDQLATITNTADKLSAMEQITRQWPDDLQTRYMLASFYMSLGRYDDAAKQFGILVKKTAGQDPDPMAHEAQALYMISNGHVDKRIQMLLNRTLALAPSNSVALDISGMAAYDAGDYKTAVSYWERLLPTLSDHKARKALVEGIVAAERKMGLNPDVPQVRMIHGPELKVTVTLGDSLKNLPKTARAFVYTCPSGTTMPLTILSLTVADLPGTFDLGQADPMQAGIGLKSHQSVDVVARVSLSGDVMHPDYQVRVTQLEAGSEQTHQVTITP